MKKLFTLFAAAIASLAMFAIDPVVIDFTANPLALEAFSQQDPITITSGNVTVTFNKGTATADPRLDPDHMRVYKNSNFTVSDNVNNIKSIIFTETSATYSTSNLSATVGTFENPKWTGDAASVQFNANAQVRLNKITVYYDSQVVVEEPDTIVGTIADIIAAQATEVNTTDFFQTTGVITAITNTQYGNLLIADGNDTIVVYGTQDFANQNLSVGDTITVLGKMKLYKGTLEFVDVIVLGKGGNNGGQGGDQGTFDPSIAHTIAEIKAAQAAGLVKDDDEIIIKGFIKSMFLKPNNFVKYGSVTIWLTSSVDGEEKEFELYNCYGLNGDTLASYVPVADAELGDGSKSIDVESVTGNDGVMFSLGDEVVAKGAFKLYNGTYELNTGCYIIEGGMKTALRQEKAAVKSVKFVENGQLVIVKDGVRFNALGARF